MRLTKKKLEFNKFKKFKKFKILIIKKILT